MKGDFSRSTFDPHKHYSSVRMQQGRVQLDADWNEQADILLHLIVTQLQDLLGPAGTTLTEPGFAITLVEPVEEAADPGQVGQAEGSTAPARTRPDFWIGAGRYYVDGSLCENEEDVLFSEQPDYTAAASLLGELEDHGPFLVYLDVWQRHITAVQDPAIREVALGGADTTTRVKTVWQVKLCSLAEWEKLVKRTGDKGCLQAKWDKETGGSLENRLYRVEIHAVKDQATFKWSRENGSVVFPLKSDGPAPVQDSQGRLCVTVEGLNRDPYQLQEDSWVELVDDVMVLNGCPLPLCQVKELDRQKGEVKLSAESSTVEHILGEIARGLRHPLLRRWEDDAKTIRPQTDTPTAESDPWLDLENGIQVAFSDTGSYQVGDYWLIPARTGSEYGIEWPQKDDGPVAQAPHGVVHHYAPLALLQSEGGEWRVIPDDTARFATLPQVEAHLNCVDDDLGNHGGTLADLDHRVTDSEERLAGVDDRLEEHAGFLDRLEEHAGISAGLDHRVKVLEERQTDFQAPLVQYFQIAKEIAEEAKPGHVVSVVPPADGPHSELHVKLTSAEKEQDGRLVVGVLDDISEDGTSCRVVLYGRARCKVVGEIEPGDVLVPSAKLGYAQKAGRFPRAGTILGKALGSIRPDPEVIEDLEKGKRLDEIPKSKRTGTVDLMVVLG